MPPAEARRRHRSAPAASGAEAADRHRLLERDPDGIIHNRAESPLRRLAQPLAGAPPFLGPHHLEAGERVRRLVERAQLQPRLTMRYAPEHRAGASGPGRVAELGDMAADARAALADLHRCLPPDCAGVVLDVCGFLKGLQQVESERGWPRRSAKLVLRIGLEQLASHYGLAAATTGRRSRRSQVWMDARPRGFG